MASKIQQAYFFKTKCRDKKHTIDGGNKMITKYDINYSLTKDQELDIQKQLDKAQDEMDAPHISYEDSIANDFDEYGIPAEITGLGEDLTGEEAEEWLDKNKLTFAQCLVMVTD